MKYVILNNINDANALNSRINFDLSVTWQDGITNNYSIPKKHPTQNLWAIIIENGYEQYFTPEELENSIELSSDWTPQFNMPI